MCDFANVDQKISLKFISHEPPIGIAMAGIPNSIIYAVMESSVNAIDKGGFGGEICVHSDKMTMQLEIEEAEVLSKSLRIAILRAKGLLRK